MCVSQGESSEADYDAVVSGTYRIQIHKATAFHLRPLAEPVSRAALLGELRSVRQIVAGAFRTIRCSIHGALHFQMVAGIFGRHSAGVQRASHPAGDFLRITRWGQIHDTG